MNLNLHPRQDDVIQRPPIYPSATAEPSRPLPRILAPSLSRSPWLQSVVLLLFAFIVMTVGLNAAPLDGHEILVAQTAREMQQRGDWIVPWFNQEMRLNKPPLNYWLTAAVARLTFSPQIMGWHARLVSTLGGLLMVAMTLWVGRVLRKPATGVTAALLMVSSVGVMMFARDGRPDMLYAGLCSMMIAFWIHAWKQPQAGNWSILGMWATAALATLSKGPHLPLVFLASFVWITWQDGRSFREGLRLFRPFIGMILVMAIISPWWVAVYWQIGDALWDSQLAGKRYGLGPEALMSTFYLYRPLVMILPWCFLWFYAAKLIPRHTPRARIGRMMLTIIVFTLLALSLAHGKRQVYLLPLMLPMTLLLALGADHLAMHIRRLRHWSWPLAQSYLGFHAGLTVLVILITTMMAYASQPRGNQIGVALLCICGVAATACIAAFDMGNHWGCSTRQFRVATRWSAVIFAWFIAAASLSATMTTDKRQDYMVYGDHLRQQLSQTDHLYAMGVDIKPLIYYANHPITPLQSMQTLDHLRSQTKQPFYLVTTRKLAARWMMPDQPPMQGRLVELEGKFALFRISPAGSKGG